MALLLVKVVCSEWDLLGCHYLSCVTPVYKQIWNVKYVRRPKRKMIAAPAWSGTTVCGDNVVIVQVTV